MREQMIALLCKPREIESSRQIVAFKCLGSTVASITDIVLSRASLKFLEVYCTELGLGNDPEFFETEADQIVTTKPRKTLFWGPWNLYSSST